MIIKYFSRVEDALPDVFKSDLDGIRGMRKANTDRICIITGNEGSGKSNFMLQYLEKWYKTLGVEVTDNLIDRVSTDELQFAQSLKTSKKYDMVVVDEGVTTSYARNSMSKVNKHVNLFLQQCRGFNYHIVFLIPNLLDLDSYLRKTRISSLYVILPNYKVAYFTRKRIRLLLPRLQHMQKANRYPDVMATGISPIWVSNFSRYEGTLLEKYDEKKQAGMHKAQKGLIEALEESANEDQPKHKKNVLTKTALLVAKKLQEGKNQNQIANEMGLSKQRISALIGTERNKGRDLMSIDLLGFSQDEV